jgi:choline monooxygenase
MKKKLFVHPDIRLASTIHKDFYLNDKYFKLAKKSIFHKKWHFACHAKSIQFHGDTIPIYLLPAYLDIPLILQRQADQTINCFSNVCTHRGNILVENPGNFKKITCRYHGRRFDSEGKVEFMPEFKEVENFPSNCDHLPSLSTMLWKDLVFVNPSNTLDPAKINEILDKYLGFEPVQDYLYSEQESKSYTVQSHWALYCENYLEGFHIPFVHKQLNEMLDYGKYEVRCYDDLILQIGYSDDSGICFQLPKGHPLFGAKVSAFYFFLFPNVMLNFYTWGLSINIVEPVRKNLSKVHFKTYIKDPVAYEEAQTAALIDKVEREDESIVENVQKGVKSPFYKRGRYSVTRETGVHHFHRLISKALS